MQANLLDLLCRKNNISYILFDDTFTVLESQNISVKKGSDLRDFLWEIVGLEESIIKLTKREEKIDIPMLLRDGEYYDLDIESLEGSQNDRLFIAYIQKKSQHTHTYAEAIKAINKKTLIYDSDKTTTTDNYYKEINKQLITFHVDLDGIICLANDACSHFFNLEKDKLIGKHFSAFFDTQKSQLDHNTNIFSAQDGCGKRVFFHVTVIPLYNNENKIIQNIMIAQDITFLKKMKKALDFANDHDTLTGLANRHALLKTIDKYIQQEESFALCYIDIDNFSLINEEYGAHAGDMLLKHVTLFLVALVEAEDLLSRLQNDVFAIVFDPKKSRKYIQRLFEALQELQQKPFLYSEEDTIHFTFSALLLFYPEEITSAKEFLTIAKKQIAKDKTDKKLTR
jgi:diguanylate cyclase (GGDEF)-like protein